MASKEKVVVLQEKENVTYELLPPEGGWGYVIVLSTAAVFIFTVVPMAAFGLMYGGFLRQLGDETSGTTLANGLFNTVYSFTGLIANVMLANMSCRKVGIIGAVIYFVGAVGIMFVETLFQLIVCFGFIQGLGFGLMSPAVFTSFNLYFDKKKSFMMSVAQTMMVAGIMMCPSLVKLAMDYYGFRGTLAIVAAMSLNCLVATATLQPVSWHVKKRRISVHEAKHLIEAISKESLNKSRRTLSREMVVLSRSAAASNEKLHKNSTHQTSSLCEDVLKSQIEPLLELKNGKAMAIEEGLRKGMFRYVVKPRPSIVSMGSRAMSVSTINKYGNSVIDGADDETKQHPWKAFIESMQLSLFKSPKYINISLGLSLSVTADLVFISLIPLLIESAGYKNEVTSLMTIYFGFDLLSRTTLSVITAFVSIKNRYLFLIGSLMSAIFRTGFTMHWGYWWTAFTTAALGFSRCLIQTPMPLVIAEEYSDRFASAFSLYMVVNGVVSLIFGPLVGFVKNVTQSDNMVVHLLSLSYMLCVIPWSIEIFCTKVKGKT